MSFYPNVTEQDLENLRKLADQQKNERALKIKNRILKQTHDIKLAESLSPITEKLDEVNKSTQEVGDIIKESNSEKEVIPSILLKNTFNSLIDSDDSLKIIKDKDGNMSILNKQIKFIGGDRLQLNNNIYEFSPEINKALSNKNYTGKSMKNDDDQRTLYNFLRDIGYNGLGDKKTNQKKIFTKLIKIFGNIKKEEPNSFEGKGIHKIIIPSNIIDIYTRLEILLGIKISGHTDTLTEASNLIDELYKRGEIRNKQQYRNALDKFT